MIFMIIFEIFGVDLYLQSTFIFRIYCVWDDLGGKMDFTSFDALFEDNVLVREAQKACVDLLVIKLFLDVQMSILIEKFISTKLVNILVNMLVNNLVNNC